ncbi:MAG: hypothetical protein JO061_24265 [Acidobacteriaceae bacterium]|nr:hypothetical protein [Acidobacteriaceae bacterium]
MYVHGGVALIDNTHDEVGRRKFPEVALVLYHSPPPGEIWPLRRRIGSGLGNENGTKRKQADTKPDSSHYVSFLHRANFAHFFSKTDDKGSRETHVIVDLTRLSGIVNAIYKSAAVVQERLMLLREGIRNDTYRVDARVLSRSIIADSLVAEPSQTPLRIRT